MRLTSFLLRHWDPRLLREVGDLVLRRATMVYLVVAAVQAMLQILRLPGKTMVGLVQFLGLQYHRLRWMGMVIPLRQLLLVQQLVQ